jgi:hypothetical protein
LEYVREGMPFMLLVRMALGFLVALLPALLGYFADLVAVEGDPLSDINVAIYNVKGVMKAGAVVVDKVSSPPKKP